VEVDKIAKLTDNAFSHGLFSSGMGTTF